MSGRRYVALPEQWYEICRDKRVGLSMAHLPLILLLHTEVTSDGWCDLSAGCMARSLGVSSRYIQKQLKALRDANVLLVDHSDTITHRKLDDSSAFEMVEPGVVRISPTLRPNGRTGDGSMDPHRGPERSISRQQSKSKRLASGGKMLFKKSHTKRTKKTDNEGYLKFAKQLYDALSSVIGRRPRRGAYTAWARDFRLLVESDEISIERVSRVLDWLCSPEQIKKTATRSGRMFRLSFEMLETLADRSYENSEAASHSLQESVKDIQEWTPFQRMLVTHLESSFGRTSNIPDSLMGDNQAHLFVLYQNLKEAVDLMMRQPSRTRRPLHGHYVLEQKRELSMQNFTAWASKWLVGLYNLGDSWSRDLEKTLRKTDISKLSIVTLGRRDIPRSLMSELRSAYEQVVSSRKESQR